VAEKLIEQDWSVAPPFGNTDPFDLLANKGDRFLRLQIKTTLEQHTYQCNRPHYQFTLSHGASTATKKRYTAEQVDFFVCCALDTRRFWVIPFEAATVITLKIYSGKTSGKTSRFHRYEDAWNLLEK
jgi:hypothetical protein